MICPNWITVVEVRKIIHDTFTNIITKAFDSVIKLDDILMMVSCQLMSKTTIYDSLMLPHKAKYFDSLRIVVNAQIHNMFFFAQNFLFLLFCQFFGT